MICSSYEGRGNNVRRWPHLKKSINHTIKKKGSGTKTNQHSSAASNQAYVAPSLIS